MSAMRSDDPVPVSDAPRLQPAVVESAPPAVDGSEPRAAPARPIDERSKILATIANEVGRAWACSRRDELHSEGRPAAGGWPGTLREARARVEHVFPPELRTRKMPAITGTERETAARTAYASARSEWQRHVEPEEP